MTDVAGVEVVASLAVQADGRGVTQLTTVNYRTQLTLIGGGSVEVVAFLAVGAGR